MKALEKAIEHFGSATALANKLGVVPMAVTQWKRRGQVPAERCRDIELVTNRAVTRYELRPDVFGSKPEREAA